MSRFSFGPFFRKASSPGPTVDEAVIARITAATAPVPALVTLPDATGPDQGGNVPPPEPVYDEAKRTQIIEVTAPASEAIIVPDPDAPYLDGNQPAPAIPNSEGTRPAMTHVIAVINLKGGVAKTTTTVALAEAFSAFQGKRVLVIDLDPQTNATIMLIGDKPWFDRNKQGLTLAALFQDAVNRTSTFDYERTIMRGVSDVAGTDKLDLLPSSLDMIDVQDRLAGVPLGDQFTSRPIDLLQSKVWQHLSHYDLVLIDCPPNLGIITLNGLRVADQFLIPTIPDVLSTYGIPQIVSRVKRFADEITKTIRPLGVVITKYQANSRQHEMTERDLRARPDGPPVFATRIPQANAIAAAAEHSEMQRTFSAKYGNGDVAAAYIRLAEEVAATLTAAEAQ